ncbi:hypothetical protein H6G89_12410 [Oscillatoria sp. FACHB-1407]|uniref:hypothetical protein n=1 Tax=Oscillatoria sp. FACHB-1407 TaxID=2692847 RepID=UPI001689CAFC|nr:hypothetical protein [Oscillatoria sp. FACHB-1407]MBD2461851.1 hypothetical protein [Oscillatoria sp. FACHB-1407]
MYNSQSGFDADANCIFEHLLELRETSHGNELLKRFKALFLDGDHYPEPRIREALNRILKSHRAEQGFANVFNRSCYILINYWWLKRHWQLTSKLIQLIDEAATRPATSTATAVLRRQLQRFTQSEKYQQLLDCERVINFIPPGSTREVELIGGLISQYPYLYPYYLKQWDSQDSGYDALRQLQYNREKEFETTLFNYLKSCRQESHNSSRRLVVVPQKPTSLSPEDLQYAIRIFAGKVEGSRSYQDTAQQFLTTFNQLPTHRMAKQKVGDYLIQAIQHTPQPSYGEHNFNHWLSKQLNTSQFERDNSKPNHGLLMHLCRDLIDALIVPPSAQKIENHFMFVDLITNLGATFATGLLLKIVLLCRAFPENLKAMREHVAKQFAALFKHYEKSAKEDLKWLIECLDNWLIASTIHFGRWEQSVWSSLLSTNRP